MPTSLPSQPTENQDPWYITFKAWMDGVALNISELNADRLTHVDVGGGVLKPVTSHLPPGGSTNYMLTKATGADYATQWSPQPSGTTPPVVWTLSDPAVVALSITGAASQTANIVDFRINGGTGPSLGLTGTGEVRVGPGANNLNGTLKIANTDVARKGIIFNAAAGQTAALLDLQVNASSKLSVSADGTIVAPNVGAKVIVLNAADSIPAGTPAGTVVLRRP